MNASPSVPEVPLVEIVIPVKNEQAELVSHVTRLIGHLSDGFPCAWGVTIADNGSTDGTWSLAQELVLAHPGQVRAVHLDRPGRGRAVHTFWSASDAEVVAYMDVDLSTDLKVIREVPVDWTDSPDSLDSRVRIVSATLANLRGLWRLRLGLLTGAIKVPALGPGRPPRAACFGLDRQIEGSPS